MLCGDLTNSEDVARLMDGKRANICLTDPPYGVGRDKGFDGAEGFGGKTGLKPIKRR